MIEIVIAAFAVYRLARLIAFDRIAQGLRARVGVYDLAENGEPKTWLGRLLECPYCLGIWFALPCALIFNPTWTFPLTWFAIAGLQDFMQAGAGER